MPCMSRADRLLSLCLRLWHPALHDHEHVGANAGYWTWGLDALAPILLFPLLWWFSGGGWLALVATPTVFFGMMCELAHPSILAW